MIEVKSLRKVYKLSKKQMLKNNTVERKKVAVDNISFVTNKGEIFGLLGPNGAGKTTTLRCISTLIKPTQGEILVDGLNINKQAEEVRKKISFLTNELKLDTHFTPKYTMEYFGSFYGLSKREIEERTEYLFQEFGIDNFAYTKIEELSTGMKQKLSIAVSLIHDPELVIFDEPTNGLDIITARAVMNYLQKLREQGKSVIISTHIMSVASKLCDRIAILIDGKIRANGTVQEILYKTGADDLEDAFFKLYNNVSIGEKI
ncbi:ABC transporter ATP-binding protein [Clostridium sp. D2Q-11]|uniref:ABC transporter ATP-binding protein n=1 Tax=Anaeromonas frigoriresistens TaxID=2683708 RepID=A0A942UYK4_9FIRM|nr:ABC transporter ATP-binding protein [Anaeromonas frigoriresistens]MBS4538696.1 ABC transporter ATP-binding protein [Anaeromonas frigoriresistens]